MDILQDFLNDRSRCVLMFEWQDSAAFVLDAAFSFYLQYITTWSWFIVYNAENALSINQANKYYILQ